eukprot:748821-Hanusia_phi.AAC.5
MQGCVSGRWLLGRGYLKPAGGPGSRVMLERLDFERRGVGWCREVGLLSNAYAGKAQLTEGSLCERNARQSIASET